jgi:hypothetical protein
MHRILSVLSLIVTSVLLAQTPVVIHLHLESDVLSVQGPAPAAKAGSTVRVEIPGATASQADKWTFFLDTAPMTRKDGNGIVGFERILQADATTYTITLNATDTTTIAGDSIIPSTTQPGGGSGQSRLPGEESGFRRTFDRKHDEVNLYVDKDGILVHGNIPRDIDDNDTITVFAYATTADAANLSIDIDGTFSSDDTFEVLGSAGLAGLKDLGSHLQSTGEPEVRHIVRMGTFGPYAPTSVTLKVNRLEADGKTKDIVRQYPIRINKTYLASYALLGGRSNIRFNNYALIPSKADATKTVIVNSGDANGDTRYFLVVVPYAWQLWRAANWRGRDVGKPPVLLDRLNPAIGVGLKGPSKEYMIGGSFELARGLHLMYGLHRAKVTTLSGGYSEGDVFTGTNIPTREQWSKTEHLFGVALDLRVATAMLSSLFK